MKQIATLFCATVQYMMFESKWKSHAEHQRLENSRALQQDPRFRAGISQLTGLPSTEDPQNQARLNPPILAQAKDLAMQALTKVVSTSVPTKSYSSIKQNPNELYMQFVKCLQDAVEKQIANSEVRSQLILQLA